MKQADGSSRPAGPLQRGGAGVPRLGVASEAALVCIVLAAGESRRMGRPKQLLPAGSRTVLEWVTDAALGAAVGPVLVVLGHCAEAVRACLGTRPVRVVQNPDYRSGMLSSVQAGVRAALPLLPAGGRGGFLFALGDQPHLPPVVYQHVARAFGETQRGIVVPVFAGRRGHPAAYSAAYAPEILALTPDAGLREILRRHPGDVEEVPVPMPGILLDLDTPDDYARWMGERPRWGDDEARR